MNQPTQKFEGFKSEWGPKATENVTYANEDTEFWRIFRQFWRQKGNSQVEEPKFFGQRLNLESLFNTVQQFGGFEQVCSQRKWAQVARSMSENQSTSNGSFMIKRIYERMLLELEREWSRLTLKRCNEDEVASEHISKKIFFSEEKEQPATLNHNIFEQRQDLLQILPLLLNQQNKSPIGEVHPVKFSTELKHGRDQSTSHLKSELQRELYNSQQQLLLRLRGVGAGEEMHNHPAIQDSAQLLSGLLDKNRRHRVIFDQNGFQETQVQLSPRNGSYNTCPGRLPCMNQSVKQVIQNRLSHIQETQIGLNRRMESLSSNYHELGQQLLEMQQKQQNQLAQIQTKINMLTMLNKNRQI
eukprot:TRINITY_DN11053_c0_g1_i2.p2 TRINITY_DN11053_c0_g1~~TRINITY_DN11053_c0_g1_i2.p2  ORF type:complete len:356 (-),score=13.63 TRINITY_DN11053_c0_g1_i2:2085-3152(-)